MQFFCFLVIIYSIGQTITHMIREVKKDQAGKVLGYVTYGTNTGVNDEALAEPEYILGVYSVTFDKCLFRYNPHLYQNMECFHH